MYKTFNGSWFYFNTLEQLINWLSKFNNRQGTEVYNTFLENVKVNDTDTRRIFDREDGVYFSELIPRQYLILDIQNRSLYCKNFIRTVHEWKFNPEHFDHWAKEFRSMGRSKDTIYYYKQINGFRKGPVRHTGKNYYGTPSYRTKQLLMNERRQTSYDEMFPFNKGTRGKNLPNYLWYDTYQDVEKNWKAQTKHKHQWEHKVVYTEKHEKRKAVYVGDIVVEEAEYIEE